MRNDPNATSVYLRWSEVLTDWIVCEPTDKGAIEFTRAGAAMSVSPSGRIIPRAVEREASRAVEREARFRAIVLGRPARLQQRITEWDALRDAEVERIKREHAHEAWAQKAGRLMAWYSNGNNLDDYLRVHRYD